MNGPAFDPRTTRQKVLIAYLRVSLAAVFALALLSLLVPERQASVLATAAVVLLIAAPLLRVGWLAVRWVGVGDRRFAAVAIALLAVAGVAALI